ncbi:MAG TPA: SPOR domain-containing protein [Prolixibacteraceae bacterium]|nr:SPOR domain-containing protein [Prolixibacteraceae bacterium]HPR85372.1 SPOR domain-containing protein [Prolixibacteraceae bacterium]
MEISQYIKEILLLNDCVIIPEFGGFIANYKPAKVENNQFFPPSKEIAFNNKLVSNDGLLVNYISDVEGINYFEAKQKLDSFVEETLLNLERNRNVYFEGIGYLHYDSKENLQFEPQLKENLLVDSYGLQSFTFEKLYQRQMPQPAARIEMKEPVPVIFQKRKARKLAIAIPLLIAMALIPMKHNKEYFSKSDMGLWEAITQTAPVPSAQPKEEIVQETPAPVITEQSQELKYFIIGGSFKSEENANKYIEQLKAKGYTGKNLGVFKGLNRVAMIGFATMEEAQKELNSMLTQNPSSGVWIHVAE